MSRFTTERFATLLAAMIASSCRLGGPSGDPTSPAVDGAAGFAGNGGHAGQGNAGRAGSGTGGTSGGEGGSHPAGAAGAIADAGDDVPSDALSEAGVDGDAAPLDVQADTGGASDGESDDSGPPTACVPPFASAVCDPVCNAGCPALFRCDIGDAPQTGVCVGTLLSSATEGMPCARTPLTDDCVERLSCIEGRCRRLCYRDTDCSIAANCCTTAVDVDGGPSGYRLCTPCGP